MRCTGEDIEKRSDLGLGAAPMVENVGAFHQPKVPEARLDGGKGIRFLKQAADANSHQNSSYALLDYESITIKTLAMDSQ